MTVNVNNMYYISSVSLALLVSLKLSKPQSAEVTLISDWISAGRLAGWLARWGFRSIYLSRRVCERARSNVRRAITGSGVGMGRVRAPSPDRPEPLVRRAFVPAAVVAAAPRRL